MDWNKYREDFLWFSYFGVTNDDVKNDVGEAISKCAERAYLDLSRTIGYEVSTSTIEKNKDSKKKYENYSNLKDTFKNNIIKKLCESIEDLLSEKNVTEKSYDNAHEVLCNFIVEEGGNQSYKAEVEGREVPLFKENKKITYGQAQKWINMTFKNLLVMGVVDFPKNIIKSMHIPLDSYIYDAAAVDKGKKIYESMDVKGLGLRPKSMEAWSKINDYGAKDKENSYMWYQTEIRKACEEKNQVPIEWEGTAWVAQAKRKNDKSKEKKSKEYKQIGT